VEEALHRLEMFWIDLEIRPYAGHRVLDGVGKEHRIGEIEGHGEGAEQCERGHFVPAFYIREVFPTDGLARGVGDMVDGLAQREGFGQTGVPQESAEGRPALWLTGFCRNFYLKRFEVSSSSLSNRA